MIIAIDFDQTFTADPDLWIHFISQAEARGHIVYCVTAREKWDISGIEKISNIIGADQVFFTEGRAKIPFMMELGYHVDIWIDDTPATITGGGSVMYRQE